jgi:hypothetical protein
VGHTGLTFTPCAWSAWCTILKHLPSPIFAHIRSQAQIIQYLRNKVQQGLMTREQEQDRLDLIRKTLPQIQDSLPPQRRLPSVKWNFAPSVTVQPNLTQMPPHVSGNGLAFDGALARIPGAQPQPPPQAPHYPQQQTIQYSRLPTLPEDRFKVLLAQFANTTGLRLNDRGFVIDNRAVNPWALHRAVFARNGFDSVCPSSLLSYF